MTSTNQSPNPGEEQKPKFMKECPGCRRTYIAPSEDLCAACSNKQLAGAPLPYAPSPQPQTADSLEVAGRHFLNDAYQYGLEAQGEFNPELANVALDEINGRMQRLFRSTLAQQKREAEEEVWKAVRTILDDSWYNDDQERLSALRNEINAALTQSTNRNR